MKFIVSKKLIILLLFYLCASSSLFSSSECKSMIAEANNRSSLGGLTAEQAYSRAINIIRLSDHIYFLEQHKSTTYSFSNGNASWISS